VHIVIERYDPGQLLKYTMRIALSFVEVVVEASIITLFEHLSQCSAISTFVTE